MKKIPAFIIFMLIPLFAGYYVASAHGHKSKGGSTNFITSVVVPTDQITLVSQGTISVLTNTGATTIPTNHQQLIEASPLGDNYLAVDKQINYSSLEEFSPSGQLIKTLQDGNTGNIDTMNWFTDPSIQNSQNEIAFVSDKDKDQTNVLDNVLFSEDLTTGTITKIAAPDPHSGGIAHPSWDPANANIITYDYYQYDDNYSPYSIINDYDSSSGSITPLTTQEQNAYQGSFSPDGKQFIFLGRNSDFSVTMYVANFSANGLSNIRSVATGDFAYPTFSFTPTHIYYLQAQGNSGYDLYTATIQNGKLAAVSPISTDSELLANSGFTVTKAKQDTQGK